MEDFSHISKWIYCSMNRPFTVFSNLYFFSTRNRHSFSSIFMKVYLEFFWNFKIWSIFKSVVILECTRALSTCLTQVTMFLMAVSSWLSKSNLVTYWSKFCFCLQEQKQVYSPLFTSGRISTLYNRILISLLRKVEKEEVTYRDNPP